MSDATATPAAPAPSAAPAVDPAQIVQAATNAAPAAAPASPAPAAPAEPAPYVINPVEGVTVDPSVLGKYTASAKELNIPQTAAQKLLETVAPEFQAAQQAAFKATTDQWLAQTAADTEIGGAKLSENVANAKAVLDKIATPELKALLESTRLGDHPELIRMFHRLAPLVKNDTFVNGTRAPANATKSAAQVLYGSN
jgi:hypothetical protein